MNALHVASTLVLLLVAFGLMSRQHPRRHLKFMVAALVLDLSLVLYLEITRSAVEKVTSHPMGPLLAFHVTVSVIVLLIYAAQVSLGIRKLRGGTGLRLAHRYLGMAFVLFRLLNYATSYAVVKPASAQGGKHEDSSLAQAR